MQQLRTIAVDLSNDLKPLQPIFHNNFIIQLDLSHYNGFAKLL